MKMRLFFMGFLWAILIACSAPAKEPQKKLSKNEMAEIIADLAIYNQSYLIDPKINLENVDRFVLKKHHISAEDFRENYQFYLFAPSAMDEIFNQSKKIIQKKDPNLDIKK